MQTATSASTPVRYAVLPRPEVNRASESPFNRAVLELSRDHTQAECPDRHGPPAIELWQAGSGWTKTVVGARRH